MTRPSEQYRYSRVYTHIYLDDRRHQHLPRDHSCGFPCLYEGTVQAVIHCLCSGRHPTRWNHCLVQNAQLVALQYLCRSLAVCTPPQHHSGPRSHHTLCPTVHWSRSPLCRYSCWFHLPVECPLLVLWSYNYWYWDETCTAIYTMSAQSLHCQLNINLRFIYPTQTHVRLSKYFVPTALRQHNETHNGRLARIRLLTSWTLSHLPFD